MGQTSSCLAGPRSEIRESRLNSAFSICSIGNTEKNVIARLARRPSGGPATSPACPVKPSRLGRSGELAEGVTQH